MVHYKHEEKAAQNKDNIIHAQLGYFRMVSFYSHIDIIIFRDATNLILPIAYAHLHIE